MQCLSVTMEYLWSKFQQIPAIFGGERDKKHAKRADFMAVASPRKHLKIYNSGTRNAILMKFTKIMYHHKTFHLEKDWGVNHRAYEGVVKKPLKKSQKIVFSLLFLEFSGLYQKQYHISYFALHCITGPNFKNNPTAFGGVISKKPSTSSLKSTFVVLRKHLKIHNVATTNAILMKLTTIMYLHDTFHSAKNWVVILRA